MGCTTSTPERAPKQPLPDLQALKSTPVKPVKGEPTLSTDADMTNATESVSLCMRQTNAQKNGNTFEIAPPDAAEIDKDDLLVEPAFGIGGQQIRRQLQDLLVLNRNKRIDPEQAPICYIIRDVARGTNYYQILKTTPIRDTQEPISALGPNRQRLYIFALIEFDLHSHVCSIRLDGQGKNAPPLYTCRQCNANDWVILKAPLQQPVALVSQTEGLMPKFTAWNLTCAPNANQALIVSLAVCIDWFVQVMKKEMIGTFE